jgi:hypothetical protein
VADGDARARHRLARGIEHDSLHGATVAAQHEHDVAHLAGLAGHVDHGRRRV